MSFVGAPGAVIWRVQAVQYAQACSSQGGLPRHPRSFDRAVGLPAMLRAGGCGRGGRPCSEKRGVGRMATPFGGVGGVLYGMRPRPRKNNMFWH
eukprot:9157137-Alexandrium_andersonii.AAC.1